MPSEPTRSEDEAGSPEAVALKLLQWLQHMENFSNRQDLLDAYAECLQATKGQREMKSRASGTLSPSWPRPTPRA